MCADSFIIRTQNMTRADGFFVRVGLLRKSWRASLAASGFGFGYTSSVPKTGGLEMHSHDAFRGGSSVFILVPEIILKPVLIEPSVP